MSDVEQPSVFTLYFDRVDQDIPADRPHYVGPAHFWDSMRRSANELAMGMLEVVIIPDDDEPRDNMVFTDYLTYDWDTAKALGVVLLQGNKFHYLSDIRIDEHRDTEVAIARKVIDWLITELQQRSERMETQDMPRSRDEEGVPFERSVLRREYLEMKYRLESLEK